MEQRCACLPRGWSCLSSPSPCTVGRHGTESWPLLFVPQVCLPGDVTATMTYSVRLGERDNVYVLFTHESETLLALRATDGNHFRWDFKLDVLQFGVSLIDDAPQHREVAYLSLQALQAHYRRTPTRQSLCLDLGSLQMDDQSYSALHPVVLGMRGAAVCLVGGAFAGACARV